MIDYMFTREKFCPLPICEPKVSLVPIGYDSIVTHNFAAETWSGETMQVIGFEKNSKSEAAPIPANEITSWLECAGFSRKPVGGKACGFVRNDIAVRIFPSEEDDSVKEVLLDFTMCRRAHERVPVWQEVVTALCATWPLRIYDPSRHSFVDAGAFRSVLYRAAAWQTLFPEDRDAS